MAGRAALVVFILFYTLTVTGALPWQGEPQPFVVALAVALCFPWMIAGSMPVLATGLTLVAVAAQIALGIAFVPGNVLLLLVIYSLAAKTGREVSLTGVGVSILLVLTAATVHADAISAVVPAVAATLIILGAWSAGTNARLRSAYERSLDERAEQLMREQDHLAQIAAADERTRIARDLHDVISHSLANILMLSEGTMRASAHLHENDRQVLNHISESCRSSLGELRRLLQVLRDEPPEMTTPSRGVDGIAAPLTGLSAAGIEVEFVVHGDRREVSGEVQQTLLRVVQEATTNVMKHGTSVTRVVVTLTFRDTGLDIEITDDGELGGAGDDQGDTASGGFGLRGMRERVELLDGSFDAGPRPEGVSPSEHTCPTPVGSGRCRGRRVRMPSWGRPTCCTRTTNPGGPDDPHPRRRRRPIVPGRTAHDRRLLHGGQGRR
nr:sensor histidine kinase [Mobilicoccus caccae]